MIIRATIFLVLFVLLRQHRVSPPATRILPVRGGARRRPDAQLLPMIVSVTLAHGSIRLSRKQVIVKRQSAMDDLGSMECIAATRPER